MKRLFVSVFLALLAVGAAATTLNPVQLLNPAGSTAGQAAVSTGPTTPPTWGNVTVTALAAQAANTVVGNVTAASASPTAVAMPSCSTTNSALKYTSATGFSCGTTYALTSGTLAQFATTTSAQLAGIISDESGSGSLVFATGAAINPTSTGATTPGTGAFTTLSASSSDVLTYFNTSGQSIANSTATIVTGWTSNFDRLGANFNASTGVFTAPSTGYYHVDAAIEYAATAPGAVADFYQVFITVNGVNKCIGQQSAQSTGNTTHSANVGCDISISSGQTLTIGTSHNFGAATALSTGAGVNYVSIHRLP